jgi:hypothetical protein
MFRGLLLKPDSNHGFNGYNLLRVHAVEVDSKMKTAKMPIRVVFYRDDTDASLWIAHCLEFDLMGHGTDRKKAMAMLTEAIDIQLKNTMKSGNFKNLFTPAPAEYQLMYAQGQNVVQARPKAMLHFAEFEIDGIAARQYIDEVAGERHVALA